MKIDQDRIMGWAWTTLVVTLLLWLTAMAATKIVHLVQAW